MMTSCATLRQGYMGLTPLVRRLAARAARAAIRARTQVAGSGTKAVRLVAFAMVVAVSGLLAFSSLITRRASLGETKPSPSTSTNGGASAPSRRNAGKAPVAGSLHWCALSSLMISRHQAAR